jgi:hypothetical protein
MTKIQIHANHRTERLWSAAASAAQHRFRAVKGFSFFAAAPCVTLALNHRPPQSKFPASPTVTINNNKKQTITQNSKQ